jgi:hypothetical protein
MRDPDLDCFDGASGFVTTYRRRPQYRPLSEESLCVSERSAKLRPARSGLPAKGAWSRVSFFMNRFRKLGFIEYNGEIRVHNSLLNIFLQE